MRSGTVNAGSIEVFYEDYGREEDPAVFLVMGFGCQLTAWPMAMVNGLTENGFRVIRFDNRDVGLSGSGNRGRRINLPLSLVAPLAGIQLPVNYTLREMMYDTIGLADALGIEHFHIVGASMGGIISQMLTAVYPERVLSLTSIMSTTANPRLPQPRAKVAVRLVTGGNGHDEDSVVKRDLKTWKIIAGPHYPINEAATEQQLREHYRRAYRPAGTLRQLQAIAATGNIETWVKQIQAPSLIIHGDADPLVRYEGGKRSAELIQNSRLETIKGMGHSLPEELLPRFVEWISDHALNCRHTPAPVWVPVTALSGTYSPLAAAG
ncbi:MAG: alpha/beta hydrolase [Ketobacteraceae bacterium]|nr:alpha/beta hydrolase [Ketobacteraceae bacterium]